MPDYNEQIPLAAFAAELIARYERPQAAMTPLLFEVQRRQNYISPQAEAEVAELLGVSPTEVHQAVTFYPLLFDKPVGKHLIQFCHNISCNLLGAENLIEILEQELGVHSGETTPDGLITLRRAECLGCCADAPVMLVDDKLFGFLTKEKVLSLIAKLRAGEEIVNDTPLTPTAELDNPALSANFQVTESFSLKTAESRGGYQALRKALHKMTPPQILEEVKASGLRGQGGAGFPTGMKWSFVPKDLPGPRYLCVNGDESEPGTFKDRELLRRDPHRLIEGIVIACKAIGVKRAYIYIRREFQEPRDIFYHAVQEAHAAGYLGENILGSGISVEIYDHPGAGAYICGEETGLIESLEGKKGWPRIRPPFPAVKGLFGRPTVVNNIETISNLPFIINHGAKVYRSRGTEKSPGTKLFGVSGQVRRPGVYELPMGTPLKEIIYGVAGGIREGGALKAVIPGGSSVQVLRANEIDVPMDFEGTKAAGTSLGSGGIIVMDTTVFMPQALEVISRFYAHESCGQCTPCREGTAWIYKILQRMNTGRGQKGDLDLLLDLANNMDGTTICPLASAAAWPVQAMLKKFPAEFEKLIKY
ncbi:MAG: NADH-quinone oxidoreductase subunit NuoF [Calditrichota bacterium]